jgi:hypothetical protein
MLLMVFIRAKVPGGNLGGPEEYLPRSGDGSPMLSDCIWSRRVSSSVLAPMDCGGVGGAAFDR